MKEEKKRVNFIVIKIPFSIYKKLEDLRIKYEYDATHQVIQHLLDYYDFYLRLKEDNSKDFVWKELKNLEKANKRIFKDKN